MCSRDCSPAASARWRAGRTDAGNGGDLRGRILRLDRWPGCSSSPPSRRLLAAALPARDACTRCTASATHCSGPSSRLTNITFFNYLFGDSSAVVHYLRALGYRLAPVEQTGSNFGMEVKHDCPRSTAVGTGTLVSDGLSFINAEFSATSFRVVPDRHRETELPRQQHRLPGRRPHRRRLPARHQGDGPDRRAGPGRGRAARLPLLRNPPVGTAGPPLRPSRYRSRAAPPAGRQEPAQRRHRRAGTCWCGGSTCSRWG